MIEYVLVRFQEELQSRFTELQRQTVGLEDLCHDRILLKTKAQRLVDAIAAAGHSSSLLSNLAAVESRIEDIDRRIDSFKPIDVAATVNDLHDLPFPAGKLRGGGRHAVFLACRKIDNKNFVQFF